MPRPFRSWIEADVTADWSVQPMDIWHDRAVFHFLTDPRRSSLLPFAAPRDAQARWNRDSGDVRAAWPRKVQRPRPCSATRQRRCLRNSRLTCSSSSPCRTCIKRRRVARRTLSTADCDEFDLSRSTAAVSTLPADGRNLLHEIVSRRPAARPSPSAAVRGTCRSSSDRPARCDTPRQTRRLRVW